MKLLCRLVTTIRAECPPPFCLSVKLNSADYMEKGAGLEQEEGLEQVRWLVECGMVDFVEISGGNAENKTSGLHQSFGKKTMDKAPKMRESTRIREAFFTEFAEKVQALESKVPIQLSGGFRSRTGMADALDSGVCQLIGLGRAAVLEPELPRKVLLNPEYDDELALGMSHIVRGQWIMKWIPVRAVGSGLPIKFFYYNMRRLGQGLSSDPDASIPYIVAMGIWETLSGGLFKPLQQLISSVAYGGMAKTE
jgi:2,4-dienoyl-CoA reductase-like NADH-dependent reductase (Old Yellow Enzyme family)